MRHCRGWVVAILHRWLVLSTPCHAMPCIPEASKTLPTHCCCIIVIIVTVCSKIYNLKIQHRLLSRLC